MLARVLSAFLLSAIALSPAARASEGPPPVLNVKTYTSPSGEYAITVDPSALLGSGTGHYTLSHNGKVEWSKDLPYTLWECEITNAGVIGGYAYTRGWRGLPDKPGGKWNGSFISVILAPDGSERLKETMVREESRMLHSPPEPTAQGSFIDAANDRLTIRFRGSEDEKAVEVWKRFRLSSGESLPEATIPIPTGAARGEWFFLSHAQSLGATGLTAIFYSHTLWGDNQVKSEGLRLVLLDADLKPVWTLDRPEEFKGVPNFVQWAAPWKQMLSITNASADSATLEFRSLADQSRISFKIEKSKDTPGAWTGAETARVPDAFSMDRVRTREVPFPKVTLEPRGTLTLQDTGSGEAPLDVFAFSFDGQGRIGFISSDKAYHLYLRLFSPAGEDLKSIPLPAATAEEHRGRPVAAWVGGDRWVAVQGSYDKGATTAIAIDTAAGNATPIDNFEGPKLSTGPGIAGFEGGFALLGSWEQQGLWAYDASGKKLWVRDRIGISPQSLAAGPDTFVVLSGIDNLLIVYDRAGEFKNSIKLESTLGAKPNYVSHLGPGRDGRWVLHDFQGKPPVYILDSAGKPLSSFTPKYPDGNTFTIMGGVARAPGKDGALWTSDGAALLRLDEKGVVDKVIGRAPTAESMGELRIATIDRDGTIYAVDGRNAWVHVYDPAGKHLRTMKPTPGDFTLNNGGLGSITIDGDGNVYYRPDSSVMSHRGYLKLRADGTREGFQPTVTHDVQDDWWFRPGTKERLVLGYHEAFLIDADGKQTARIDRRADRRWLENPHEGAIAVDGSFAIYAMPSAWNSDSLCSISLYRPDGQPIRTVDLPGFGYGRIAFNGATAVAIDSGTLVLISAATGEAITFAVPDAAKTYYYPFLSPDGKEVWLLDNESKTFRRFALPA